MSNRYPNGFEVTYSQGNRITDDNTANDYDMHSNYYPFNDAFDTYDPTHDTTDKNSTKYMTPYFT